VRHVWLFASSQPDTVVDIAPGFDRKIHARLEHVSQTPDPVNLAAQWRKRAAEIGATGPVPPTSGPSLPMDGWHYSYQRVMRYWLVKVEPESLRGAERAEAWRRSATATG
jgi:hypothetical protein